MVFCNELPVTEKGRLDREGSCMDTRMPSLQDATPDVAEFLSSLTVAHLICTQPPCRAHG